MTDTTAERKCTGDCWFSPPLCSLTAENYALRAQLATAEAQAQTARDDALREAAGALHTTSDSIWGRMMREAHRNILALIQTTPTTDRTDAATEE